MLRIGLTFLAIYIIIGFVTSIMFSFLYGGAAYKMARAKGISEFRIVFVPMIIWPGIWYKIFMGYKEQDE